MPLKLDTRINDIKVIGLGPNEIGLNPYPENHKNGHSFGLIQIRIDFDYNKPRKFDKVLVTWSAIYPNSLEDTKIFAKCLMRAYKIGKKIELYLKKIQANGVEIDENYCMIDEQEIMVQIVHDSLIEIL